MSAREADVVVIGAGPAGAAATWRLATQGLSVICLDRGDWLDPAALGFGTAGYDARRAGPFHENPNIRAGAADDPVDDADSPIKISIGNAVGGGSLWWAAHIPRYRPEDFRVRTLDGVAEDWPISYADLEPYYALNERMMGLAAVRADPAGPVRMGTSLPMPTIGPAGRKMAAAFDRLGWHWWPVDLAVGPGEDMPRCNHPGPCEPGCPARLRAGVDRTYLRPAIDAGALVLPNFRVTRLEHGSDGAVSAAVCATEAGTQLVRARRFIMAANGLGTPRLLLLSASGRHQHGLANRSGLVGRNLMLHPHARVDALFGERLDTWAPGQKAGIVCLEFLATRARNGFPRGFKMQLSPCPTPAALAAAGSVGVPLPWGAAHHRAMAARFDHVAGLTICAEDLPDPANRVTLSETMADRDGMPAAKMTYRVSQASRANLDFAIARAEEVFREAGALATAADRLKQQAGFHLVGTARMGSDPETSVVDRWGRCHDVPNLFIADASVFVTGSAMNPTATAQAFALRCADRMAREMA